MEIIKNRVSEKTLDSIYKFLPTIGFIAELSTDHEYNDLADDECFYLIKAKIGSRIKKVGEAVVSVCNLKKCFVLNVEERQIIVGDTGWYHLRHSSPMQGFWAQQRIVHFSYLATKEEVSSYLSNLQIFSPELGVDDPLCRTWKEELIATNTYKIETIMDHTAIY